MAALELFEHVVGDSLVCLDAVFDGQSVDDLELDFARLYFIVEQIFENSCGFLGYNRTDAVAAAAANYYFIEHGIVGGRRRALHFFVARKLLAQYFFKIRNGGRNIFFVIHLHILRFILPST